MALLPIRLTKELRLARNRLISACAWSYVRKQDLPERQQHLYFGDSTQRKALTEKPSGVITNTSERTAPLASNLQPQPLETKRKILT